MQDALRAGLGRGEGRPQAVVELVERPAVAEVLAQRLQEVGVARLAEARVREGGGGQDHDTAAPAREPEGDRDPLPVAREDRRPARDPRHAPRRRDPYRPRTLAGALRREPPLLPGELAPAGGVQGRTAPCLVPLQVEGHGQHRFRSLVALARVGEHDGAASLEPAVDRSFHVVPAGLLPREGQDQHPAAARRVQAVIDERDVAALDLEVSPGGQPSAAVAREGARRRGGLAGEQDDRGRRQQRGGEARDGDGAALPHGRSGSSRPRNRRTSSAFGLCEA